MLVLILKKKKPKKEGIGTVAYQPGKISRFGDFISSKFNDLSLWKDKEMQDLHRSWPRNYYGFYKQK